MCEEPKMFLFIFNLEVSSAISDFCLFNYGELLCHHADSQDYCHLIIFCY